MASFNGLELKNYKKAGIGEEGEIYSGSIYRNGKRLGTVTDDQWGGAPHYSFDSKVLGEYVEAYNRYETCPWGSWTDETLIGFLATLNQMEKQYKKLSYIGPRTLVFFTDGLSAGSCVFKNTKTTTEESIKKSQAYKRCLKEFEDSLPYREGEIKSYFFINESDFNIVV